MRKSAKEIISSAKQLAQATNSNAFSFQFLTSLLNNCYSNVYNDIVSYSNYFVKYFEFTGNEADLPADCNKVLSVFTGSEKNPHIITQSSTNNYIPGTYIIENNTIKIYGVSGKFYVKYSNIPEILTAPDEPELITLTNYQELVSAKVYYDYATKTHKIFYVAPNDVFHIYDIENQTDETVETAPYTGPSTFRNKDLTYDALGTEDYKVTWNEGDITEYFAAYDQDTGEEIYPAFIYHDNSRIAITYTNNDIYVMDTSWNKVLINPYISQGRYFKGTAFAIYTDDTIGKYLLVRDENANFFLCSYVPDTIIEFPNNVYFDYLEDLIAVQLQGQIGVQNDALQTKLTNDEMSFYNSLQKGQQGVRIRNDSNYNWRLM